MTTHSLAYLLAFAVLACNDEGEPQDPEPLGSDDLEFIPPTETPCACACDVFDQDCPEGEKCVVYSPDADLPPSSSKCVPVSGDGAPGDPCSSDGPVAATDDCDAISACWAGVCRSFCTGTAEQPECTPGFDCIAENLCVAGAVP